MEKKFINTEIGRIAIFHKHADLKNTPVVFLHGVYFDHQLWDNQLSAISDRPIIAIDMPLHGESKNIKKNWNLDDCASMLLDILDSLKVEKVIAVGHSWGSMTIIRAANKNPNRFAALGLCNMPFEHPTKKEVRALKFQHSAMVFRKFYMKQAGKALIGKGSVKNNPNLIDKLITSMSKLNNKEIKYTDKAVRMDAEDATHLITNLSMPVLAMIGEEDYVGLPPIKEVTTVKGGHVSPLEVPNEVNILVRKLTELAGGN